MCPAQARWSSQSIRTRSRNSGCSTSSRVFVADAHFQTSAVLQSKCPLPIGSLLGKPVIHRKALKVSDIILFPNGETDVQNCIGEDSKTAEVVLKFSKNLKAKNCSWMAGNHFSGTLKSPRNLRPKLVMDGWIPLFRAPSKVRKAKTIISLNLGDL